MVEPSSYLGPPCLLLRAGGPASLHPLFSCAPASLSSRQLPVTRCPQVSLHLEFMGIFLGWLCAWGTAQGPLAATVTHTHPTCPASGPSAFLGPPHSLPPQHSVQTPLFNHASPLLPQLAARSSRAWDLLSGFLRQVTWLTRGGGGRGTANGTEGICHRFVPPRPLQGSLPMNTFTKSK